MSLRRRLVIGIVVVLAAAIATTDLVTLSSLRSFLFGRIDEQADVAQSQAYTYIELNYQRAVAAGQDVAADPLSWLAALAVPPANLGVNAGDVADQPAAPTSSTGSTGSTGSAASSSGTSASGAASRTIGRLSSAALSARIGPDIYTEVIGDDGSVVFQRPSGSSAHADPTPILPHRLPAQVGPAVHTFGTNHGAYLPVQPSFTVSAVGQHGAYYEGEALDVPGGVLVTMIPLTPTNQTLDSLTRIEVIVSVIVAFILVLLVLAIVRFGLRPLDEMTATARAISGGDMRRRIRRTDERSEVGRLGAALNGMLTQIDTAFGERTASEARLRRFVADASHELRTPLTSIRGYAELLQKGALDDEEARRRAVSRIEIEARRMGELVDELLLLARLDQGRPIERDVVDISVIVTDAVDAARAADPKRPFQLDCSDAVLVDGDALRLRQMVDNLLRNASVHTPAGSAVEVSLARAGRSVQLKVTDHGPGLSPDQIERVFDRFYRGTEARGRPGTGLGLSIVAALAAAHGGSASVRSALGAGAEFTVTLPLTARDDGDEAHEPRTRPAEPARR